MVVGGGGVGGGGVEMMSMCQAGKLEDACFI